MKVLFVSSGNARDGISPIVLNQGQSLIRQGIIVDFFTVNGKGLWSYLKHIFILHNYLKKNNFDIIHAHYVFSSIVAFLAKRKEKIVVSFMGSDLIGSVNQNGKTTLSGYFESFLSKLFSKYYFDFNIVKSQNLKDEFYKNTESLIIPNGIDLLQFYPIDKTDVRKELVNPNNQKIVLFSSNYDRPEKNYKLAEVAVKVLKDPEVVLMGGFNISQQMLNKYFNASDILLLTSHHEGSPNVIKEAMACNCPIVATNVGDVKWILGNTEGCFITSFEPEDVAEKIKLAIEFRQKHRYTNGRERIIELGLDSETVARKIIEVYKGLLT